MQIEYDMSEIHPILSEVLESGGEFRLYPKGVSMLPLIREKRDSVVLITPKKPLVLNKLYLYKRKNGQYVLHRLVKFTADGEPIFRGDNQTVLEFGVETTDVIAEVARIYQGETELLLDSRKYARYVSGLSCPFFRFFRFFPRRVKNRLKRMIKK